ncbi:MAG: hypothetical protein Q8K43_10455 [Sulfurimicrobium sp.]|nr:hypothetical protein [Gallionella sp.]MDP1898296.1 hypothetical protein [Sulfurimicrobium sp.]
MKERPILFNNQMMRALLDGSKAQTRRIVKPQPDYFACGWPCVFGKCCFERNCLSSHKDNKHLIVLKSPFGKTGDQLWVRETWARHPDYSNNAVYRADPECKYDVDKWTPSIHMPRWASRIQLEITGVRVERLQDISEADALSEGVNVHPDHHGKPRDSIYSPVNAYRDLWESINGPGSWDVDPWVWVIEFRRVK